VVVLTATGLPVIKAPCFISEQIYGPGKHVFEVELLDPTGLLPLSHLIVY
jgi:hypothetical protein